MNKNRIIGLLMFAFGIFSLYWAQTHSPDSDLATKAAREISGSYSLGMPGYIFSLVVGTAFAVLGAKRAYKAK